jgi:hypothetical protein
MLCSSSVANAHPPGHVEQPALNVMSSGHKWDLPFDRMTTELKSSQFLQVFEKQDDALLVICNEVRHDIGGRSGMAGGVEIEIAPAKFRG